ncbi:LysR family transcriptional regulator, partial [Xanthomonas vasicola]
AWHRRNDAHAAHRWLRERVLELLVPEAPTAAARPAARSTAGRADLVLSVS